MAKTPDTATATAEPKVKRTRKPSDPKPIFAIVRVLDEDGNVMVLPKSRIELISFERSGDAVLAKIEDGAYPGALYLRGMLPAGR